MKRNWQVRVEGQDNYFATKAEAKVFRDSRPEKFGIHLSKGPDHPRLNDKGNPRTHSHGMNDSRGTGFPVRRGRRSA